MKKVIHGDLKPSNVLFRSATTETTPTTSPPVSHRGQHGVAGGGTHARSADVSLPLDPSSLHDREVHGGRGEGVALILQFFPCPRSKNSSLLWGES